LAATTSDVVEAQKLAGGLGAAVAPVAVGEQDFGSQPLASRLLACVLP